MWRARSSARPALRGLRPALRSHATTTRELLASHAAKALDIPNYLASDRLALPQLIQRYRKNFLTHGIEFLKGEDEMLLFAPGVWHAPLHWRPIPGPDASGSLSRATLSTTSTGTSMLRGFFGGTHGEVALLAGVGQTTEAAPVGLSACGVASRGHWTIDLAQHHWLELRLRTGQRPFDLVLQVDGAWEGGARIWRATIPEPRAFHSRLADRARATAGGGGEAQGAYGVLNVSVEATAAEIRERYRALVLELHPDRGGDEERFKAVSRAYALLGDSERRARYDELGAADGEGGDAGLDGLGAWRQIKVPFTAFRNRTFFDHHEQVAAVYLLLADENPGPFALEIGEIKAGRCAKAHLDGAGFWGHVSCEQGHCECGYYNGLRAEPFDGPLELQANGRIRPGALEWGHAEHHLRSDEFRDM